MGAQLPPSSTSTPPPTCAFFLPLDALSLPLIFFYFFFSLLSLFQSLCCFSFATTPHPSPHLSACSSLTHTPPPSTNFSHTFSMRYSCDPPAVRRLALDQLKSRSVLLLAHMHGLPHSQFTRLPRPMRAQGTNQGKRRGGGRRPVRVGSQGCIGAQTGFCWA